MKKKRRASDIQSVIMTVLSLMTVITSISMGLLLYNRYETAMRQNDVRDAQNMMETIVNSMEQYLKSMRQISDTANYNIIQALDISSPEFNQELSLLYDSNKDKIQSIALYDMEGELLVAEPVTLQKEGVEVSRQSWFENAKAKIENMHFSTPHMQDLFQDDAKRYHWVISLSRAVDVIDGDSPENGILLVDMKYSFIEEMMDRINDRTRGRYYYLCDREGKLIYHPYANEISNGLFQENSVLASSSEDGIYRNLRSPHGERQTMIVNTISYTGWKLVGVIPYSAFIHGMIDVRYFIILLMLLTVMVLVALNRVVSARISSPILKLNASVLEYEAGEKPEVYIGGAEEIRYLGYSIQKSYEQIDELMKEIIIEQNERRKSELDALQSQINPHFLYNTLDSITWMIEDGRNDEAAFMISQLAKLFRISLSKGHTVINIRDELQHARSYMNIQKIRYKNAFSVTFDVDDSLYAFCIVKLVLQPILENAINYGINGTDDCGEIKISGKMENGLIILSVTDNGIGMCSEEVSRLLTDEKRVHKHGSGVGLVNVNNRIKIVFGKEYGIVVESEPDEGTTVSICIPAVLYTEENRKALEGGNLHEKENEQKKEPQRE